ncbi:hypothetical protein QFC19_000561 [Naganishia cerealis]|uniref:Uncharacterized protein n=1 Tax=Naganishia cerealis TaxID=610337 RepID=A0ACC2WN81_9TREE|nr:hypothetical protein QFC19_000561 [Naganishia cerealis]
MLRSKCLSRLLPFALQLIHLPTSLTDKTGKKFAVSRPIKPGAASNTAAPTPASSGAAPSQPDSASQVSPPAPVGPAAALPPTPDATQNQPVQSASPLVAEPQGSPVILSQSPSQTNRPLFFPEPTPPPTLNEPSHLATRELINHASVGSAPLSSALVSNDFALPLAPQMPNPFLHPQVPPPIPSSSLAPPPSFTSGPTSFAPPASATASSRTLTQLDNDADTAAKEAEKEKRRIRRRQKQGQEGPGRAYRTTAEREVSAGGKRKRTTGKQKDVDSSAVEDGEDPEAQIMREEAEHWRISSAPQDSPNEGTPGEGPELGVNGYRREDEDEDEEDEETGTQFGRRRRGRQRKNVNDDIDLEVVVAGQALGPAIDSSSMTMAEIAAHPGYGRVSSRGLELQARRIELAKEKREKLLRQKSSKEGTADGGQDREQSQDQDGVNGAADGAEASTESAFARLMKQHTQSQKDAKAAARANGTMGDDGSDPENNDNDRDDREDDDINENDQFRERNAVTIRMDENGNMVLDEDSLQIESGQAMNEFDMGGMEVIEEHDKDRFINASSYQRKPRGTRWTREETDLLFEVCCCLTSFRLVQVLTLCRVVFQKTREFGTSFDMIVHFFPGKTRRHVINQWNRLCRNKDPRADWAYDRAHRKAVGEHIFHP